MKSSSSSKSSALWGSLLPIVIFTVVEEWKGPFWGLICAMIFGVIEVIYEHRKNGQVSKLTLVSNGLILLTGAISVVFSDGIYFKLQPALMELGVALFLIYCFIKKSHFIFDLLKKQNPQTPDHLKDFFLGLCFRLGLFFLIHSVLATYAAFYWTTTKWAILKGVGLTLSLLVYLIIEIIFLKKRQQH